MLAVGTSLSLGLALGLLLGGANRLLVILALIPATAMGFTLFDRHNGRARRGRRAPAEPTSAYRDDGPAGACTAGPFHVRSRLNVVREWPP